MTKNRTPTPVYLDPGMHPGLEVKGLRLYHRLRRWPNIKPTLDRRPVCAGVWEAFQLSRRPNPLCTLKEGRIRNAGREKTDFVL